MQVVLQDFREALGRIRDVADSILAEAPLALGDPSVLRRHETIQFASTVILSGYFESFLRDLARAYIRDICGLGVPFAGLPKVVRYSHFEHGGNVLAHVARAEKKGEPPRFPTSATDLAARLHSVDHSVPYSLVWEAFAETGANPGPQVIAEYLRRMGVEKAWPTVGGKTAAIAAHQTETWLVANLRSFIGVRNECAHAGAASVQVLPSDLRNYCDLFEALATAMVGVLEDTRQAIIPAGGGSLPPSAVGPSGSQVAPPPTSSPTAADAPTADTAGLQTPQQAAPTTAGALASSATGTPSATAPAAAPSPPPPADSTAGDGQGP
ncbi:MAG: hypothetical protein KF729_23135 [Sandaracinaceae bacterium]|nr:hypothetical protein [Sandaracinaceae bacterium]